ncbi:MAG: hypothetical protein AB3N16_07965 [Flavobacteriaceae bacterium]
MDLATKNHHIINTICKVRIRSVDKVVALPSLATLYHTPSKIRLSIRSKRTANGNLHNKSLRLTYPGLSQTDFAQFDALIKGVYQVMVQLENGEVHELASSQFPMTVSSSFNMDGGHELTFSVSAPLSITFIGTDSGNLAGKPGLLDEQFDYDFDFNLA